MADQLRECGIRIDPVGDILALCGTKTMTQLQLICFGLWCDKNLEYLSDLLSGRTVNSRNAYGAEPSFITPPMPPDMSDWKFNKSPIDTMNKITFDGPTPTEPGVYCWREDEWSEVSVHILYERSVIGGAKEGFAPTSETALFSRLHSFTGQSIRNWSGQWSRRLVPVTPH